MTNIRSYLFVPGDSEKKLAKADAAGADALILDLEDSVIQANKTTARELTRNFLRSRPQKSRKTQLWVRINPLDTILALIDLAAVVAESPDGVMLPKANGPRDVLRLSHYLDALEANSRISPRSIRILAVATETPAAPFQLGEYAEARLDRLAGLTWGAEDLATAVGASTNVDASGQWEFTYRLVRSMTLLAARAAGVKAIDTLYVDFHDDAGLRTSSRASRAEGFDGRIAIHPAQVVGINESYMPSPDEIDHARKVVAAFEAVKGAGTVALEGKMLDLPHFKQASALLAEVAGQDRRRP